MIKKRLKLYIVTSVVILLPIVGGLLLWNQLPDQIPIHWNGAGEVDGWSGKGMAVFGLPLFLLAIHWFTMLVTQNDPKKKNHSEKVIELLFWFIPALNLVLSLVIYLTAMGREVRVAVILPVLMGALFIVIGNYLPKCRQNYTIGIKLPWTLHSEENWNKTHRLAGWLWVIGGVLMMVCGFANVGIVFLPVVLLMAFVPIVYSYLLHRKGI